MKILFIGHEATRSGAPISLLMIIGYLKENLNNFFCEVLLIKGGPLVEEYQKFGKTKVLDYLVNPFSWKNRIKNRVRRHFLSYFIQKYYQSYFNSFDLIFVNSSASLRFLDDIRFSTKARKIIRIPELPFSIELLLRSGEFQRMIPVFDHIITGSKAAMSGLVNEHELSPEKIRVIYGAINPLELKAEEFNLRKEFDLPENAFIVGGSGRITWGKGFDIFLQVCRKVVMIENNIYFIWLGQVGEDDFLKSAQYDIKQFGLKNRLRILPHVDEPQGVYKKFDLFFLSSRIDTFPLVCLENAFFEKPIVCFQGAGGAVEFAERGCGTIASYLDVEGAAAGILNYYNDPTLLKKHGQRGKEEVLKNFSIEKAGAEVLNLINAIMGNDSNDCHAK